MPMWVRYLLMASGFCTAQIASISPDNALMESFFDSLKTEYPECLKFKNIDQARLGLFEYIEIFYNRERIHSSIDYQRSASNEQPPCQ